MNFVQYLISDSSQVSFGRFGACAIVTTWLVICGYISIVKTAVIDIPLQWAGLATLLYGIAKAGETSQKNTETKELK
jgi:hypothetical protein